MREGSAPVERLLDRVVGEWLLAHERGLTAAETQAFEAWLARAPMHAEAWAKANELWSAFEQETDPAIDIMLTSARAMRPPIFSSTPSRIAAAAVVVVALGLAGVGWRQAGHWARGGQEVAETAAAFTPYAAGGALTPVKLPDGSEVLLDVGSEVEVRQTASRRDVRLTQGQAFFTVAHDPKRPFTVAARDDIITDVGTAFAVTLQSKATSVVLASGLVRVAHHGQAAASTVLVPGQQYLEEDGRPAVVTSIDVPAKLAWRTGDMELNDTPLAEAVAQLNRHAKTPVLVGDAKAAALKLSGRYRLDDPAGFAQSIAAIYPVQVRSRGGGLVIISK